MKAAYLTDPRRSSCGTCPSRWRRPAGWCLTVKACGICGSDLRRWKEGPPKGVDGVIPGHEVGGVVVAAGKGLTRFAVGDHLAIAPDVHCGRCYYCKRGLYNLCDELRFVGINPEFPGGLAEKLVLSEEVLVNGIVHRMPEGMSFAEGSLAEPSCSVIACHDRAGTRSGRHRRGHGGRTHRLSAHRGRQGPRGLGDRLGTQRRRGARWRRGSSRWR